MDKKNNKEKFRINLTIIVNKQINGIEQLIKQKLKKQFKRFMTHKINKTTRLSLKCIVNIL